MLQQHLHDVLLTVLSIVTGIAAMLYKAILNRSYAARVKQMSHIVANSQTGSVHHVCYVHMTTPSQVACQYYLGLVHFHVAKH